MDTQHTPNTPLLLSVREVGATRRRSAPRAAQGLLKDVHANLVFVNRSWRAVVVVGRRPPCSLSGYRQPISGVNGWYEYRLFYHPPVSGAGPAPAVAGPRARKRSSISLAPRPGGGGGDRLSDRSRITTYPTGSALAPNAAALHSAL